MIYLVIGFILGVAASWFWQSQFGDIPAFRHIMRRELAVNGQLGSMAVIKKRIEDLEQQLTALEQRTSGEYEQEAHAVQVLARTVAGGEAAPPVPAKPVESRSKKINRDQVISLWKEGRPVAEIASHSRMGKGEVELIIAMYDRLKENR